MLSTLEYTEALERAGVLEAISLTKYFSIGRDKTSLEKSVLRWSADTHTFINAWGEFISTLLDVHALLALLILGDTTLFFYSTKQ